MADLLLLACFLAGLVLVSVGAWMVSAPAGLTVAGLLLVVVSLVYTRGAPGTRGDGR